ncbi:hypothetical protein PROVALCAL_01124 [Providencia alcalifaciens DSM 30120]|uniref:Uncharacterized protein n=1 Tax=Providencia alcalifaciens DSM 30120 TaxID=520999 RepID=B6XCQ8_9GAMM|nr:hypothetical protein PROVALCAL_01124 [Providencia alcalifaciens DSM 30120]
MRKSTLYRPFMMFLCSFNVQFDQIILLIDLPIYSLFNFVTRIKPKVFKLLTL